MAFSADTIDDDPFDGVGAAYASLGELLAAAVRALVDRVGPIEGAIRLDDTGTLTIGDRHGVPAIAWLAPDDAAAAQAAVDAEDDDPIRLPIAYAGMRLGEFRIDRPRAIGAPDRLVALAALLAGHCGALVKRYEVRRWSTERLGRPLLLVGMSRPLRALERFLELAATCDLPVLLRGEFGTEKAQLAAAIHCLGARAAGPLVQIDCAHPDGPPAAWVKRAAGGTLYLSGIDELDEGLQRQLPRHLPSRLDRWLTSPRPPVVRLVASTTADLHALVGEGGFSRALLAEVDFLSAIVPPLRDRAPDVDALIRQTLDEDGHVAAEKRTDALVALAGAYPWPENRSELERVVARLAVMTAGRPIHAADVRRHAPALAPHPAAADEDGGGGGGGEGEDGDDAPAAAAAPWVRASIDGGGAALDRLHAALARALVHLGRSYTEPLSLAQLAWQAGVSPSHLSYLFRSGIGMSFKTLLTHIRIHKACELLAADGRRAITDVSFSVGFADLSHFEKSFRRIVSQSPREYRRATAGR